MNGYEAVRKTSGLRDRSDEGRLRVTGPDRAAWLQGLLTNDIVAMSAGQGCYAAYLTPQGRMIADVRVLERGDEMLLDVPAAQKDFVLDRLSTFIIMEDVAVEDVTASLARLAVYGPTAAALLGATLEVGADVDLAALPEHANVVARFRGQPVLIAGARDAGVAGFDLYVAAGAKADLQAALAAGGAAAVDDEAWHTLRVEAGRPLFGVDMTTETIPLEAGIEDRAISFTKGCYVGQEIIIRVVHRGGGRVARKLVGLRPAGGADAAPGGTPSGAPNAAPDGAPKGAPTASPTGAPNGAIAASMPIVAGERVIGQVTSAARSPRLGQWIAMGYVHRDFAEPGTKVAIGEDGARVEATVTPLPGPSVL